MDNLNNNNNNNKQKQAHLKSRGKKGESLTHMLTVCKTSTCSSFFSF